MSESKEVVKKDYAQAAQNYNDFGSLPLGQLESQLIKTALGDCTDATILDLGGGTGVHAREAVELGALAVDIVDISPEMLRIGEDIERSLGHGVIRFMEADVSKSLKHLPLREEGYDVVMANWIFSNTGSRDDLEGMFRNSAHYLKPGGRFVSIRDEGRRDVERDRKYEKYGVSTVSVEDIPGGVNYTVLLKCTPPIELNAAVLEILYSGSTELYEKFGLINVEVVPWKDADVVRKDPDFWKEYLEDPACAIVKAVKKDHRGSR